MNKILVKYIIKDYFDVIYLELKFHGTNFLQSFMESSKSLFFILWVVIRIPLSVVILPFVILFYTKIIEYQKKQIEKAIESHMNSMFPNKRKK